MPPIFAAMAQWTDVPDKSGGILGKADMGCQGAISGRRGSAGKGAALGPMEARIREFGGPHLGARPDLLGEIVDNPG